MVKSKPSNKPPRSTFMGAAIRLHSHPNPNARLNYHTITNKSIYFAAMYWKDESDIKRASKDNEINYLILLHYAESDLLASLSY